MRYPLHRQQPTLSLDARFKRLFVYPVVLLVVVAVCAFALGVAVGMGLRA